MKIFAVVPAFNESQMIGSVIMSLRGFVSVAVVVDDGSEDETATVARAAGALVLRHLVNRGQGAALQTGIEYAYTNGADVIVTFDADGQHDVGDLPRLIEPVLRDRADLVLGSRFLNKHVRPSIPTLRRGLLRLAVWYTKMTTGLPVTDTHNGLRALSRRAAGQLRLQQAGMAHASEILELSARLGWRLCEVPVTIHYTRYSTMKGQTFFSAFKILWDLTLGRISKD